MSNLSFYSVFLDVDIIRPVAWNLGIIGVIATLTAICYMLYNSSYNVLVSKNTRVQDTYDIAQNPSLFLLFNLLLSDLIGAIYILILAVGDYNYTSHLKLTYGNTSDFSRIKNQWFASLPCSIGRYLAQISMLMSATLTLIISVHRYILIVNPYIKNNMIIKHFKISLSFVWIALTSVAMAIADFTLNNLHTRSPYTFVFLLNLCTFDGTATKNHAIVAFSLLSYALVLYSVAVVLQSLVIAELRKSRIKFQSYTVSTLEKRYKITLGLMIVTNVMAYCLMAIVGINWAVGNLKPNQYGKFLFIFPYLNCIIDPMTYLLFQIQNISRNLSGQKYQVHGDQKTSSRLKVMLSKASITI